MAESESAAYKQLVEAANGVINTIPDGKKHVVAVDLAAYNDLRDVLRRLGVLD